jgi:hypothetical protein
VCFAEGKLWLEGALEVPKTRRDMLVIYYSSRANMEASKNLFLDAFLCAASKTTLYSIQRN